MKPRTKYDIKINALFEKLKPISEAKKRWLIKHSHLSYFTRHYNKFVCLECNHKWIPTNKEILTEAKTTKCPSCRKHLNSDGWYKSYGNFRYDNAYVIDRCKEYQIIRSFVVIKELSKHHRPKYKIHEVSQVWHDFDKQKATCFARAISSSWDYVYCLNSPMTLKKDDPFYSKYSMGNNANIYPYWKIAPKFKQAGLLREMMGPMANYTYAIFRLMFPRFETLVKARLFRLFHRYEYRGLSDQKWQAIKIGMRYRFFDQVNLDVVIYDDYLDMLIKENKDISNPYYVCPEDLYQAHDAIAASIARKQRRELAEERKRQKQEKIDVFLANKSKMLEREDLYAEKIAQYRHLKFHTGKLSIFIIQSVLELLEHSEELNHCAFSNDYDKIKGHILFAAYYNNELVETVEVNLRDFRIMQSRGYNNAASEYNRAILALLNDNMYQIKEATHGKAKKTA